MGKVTAEITLTNMGDWAAANRGFMLEDNIRQVTVNAVVIPGADSILLGVIPLEAMDLLVNPVTQTLEGAHGDEIVTLAL